MTTAATLLPSVDFCGTRLSRLLIGGNPFRGYSHLSPGLNEEMKTYHTVERVVRTLLRAEECGINCMQSRGDDVIFAMIDAYREAGGAMHWIAQTASEKPDLFANIRAIAARGALGIYWHGSMTDRMWKEGEEEVRGAFQYAFDNIKATDVVNVGMFQKHGDQVGMNARIVRSILRE